MTVYCACCGAQMPRSHSETCSAVCRDMLELRRAGDRARAYVDEHPVATVYFGGDSGDGPVDIYAPAYRVLDAKRPRKTWRVVALLRRWFWR